MGQGTANQEDMHDEKDDEYRPCGGFGIIDGCLRRK